MLDPKASSGHPDTKFHLFLVQLCLHRIKRCSPLSCAGAVVLEDENFVPTEVKLISSPPGHSFLIPVVVEAHDEYSGPAAL